MMMGYGGGYGSMMRYGSQQNYGGYGRGSMMRYGSQQNYSGYGRGSMMTGQGRGPMMSSGQGRYTYNNTSRMGGYMTGQGMQNRMSSGVYGRSGQNSPAYRGMPMGGMGGQNMPYRGSNVAANYASQSRMPGNMYNFR
jgi:hypothetical protein